MNHSNIPIPYQAILDKLKKISFEDQLMIGEVRIVLAKIFRMPRDKIFGIINEMKDLGLIEFVNYKCVRIIWT